MLRRLLLGLIIGLVVGAAIAAGLVKGLGMVTFGGPLLAYAAAVVTGVATGLVAGKPIWSADGKIEAGLKAFFGGLLAAGVMFAVRRWLHVDVDLAALAAGTGSAGELPAIALPVVGGVLGGFFEADNDAKPGDSKASPKGGASADKVRVAAASAADEVEDDAAPPSAAKKKR